jgi:hypothetical protein
MVQLFKYTNYVNIELKYIVAYNGYSALHLTFTTRLHVFCSHNKQNSVTFSLQASYTDWAPGACQWSHCQLLWVEGVTWSAQQVSKAVNLGFPDQRCYFFSVFSHKHILIVIMHFRMWFHSLRTLTAEVVELPVLVWKQKGSWLS